MSVFDAYSEKYDTWYDAHQAAFLSEVAAARKFMPKNKYGLEIGVGTGRFAAALGISVGIDPSPVMLKQAEKRGVGIQRGKGEDLPFPAKSFDYVAIFITLCFVTNPLQVLKEAARVLKQRGRIIIGIIDKRSFLGKLYSAKKSVFYKSAYFFSIPEITDLLKESGFRQFSYYQTITQLPEKMQVPERPTKGFGKGGFVVISGTKCRKGS